MFDWDLGGKIDIIMKGAMECGLIGLENAKFKPSKIESVLSQYNRATYIVVMEKHITRKYNQPKSACV